MSDQQVSIVIRGKNLSGPEFAAARQQITGLSAEAARANVSAVSMGAGFKSAFASVTQLAGAAGLAFGAASIAKFVQSTLDAAGATVDLSAKTGISIEAIQRMQYVAEQTGSSLDAFTGAAYKLGVNLAGGSGSVQSAVQALGLSWQELQGLKPEAQFARVVGALEQVESTTERNRLGQELFGRSFAEIAVAVADGYSHLAAEARVASDEQIRALDLAGHAIDKLKKDVGTGLTQVLGSVAQAIIEIEKGADSLTTKQKAALAVSSLWGKGYLVELQQIGKQLVETERAQEAHTESVRQAAPVALTYTQQLAAARAEVARLTVDERREIDAARALGAAVTDITSRYGLSAGALRVLQEETKRAEELAKKKADAVKKAAAAQEEWRASIRATATDFVAYRQAVSDAGEALQNITRGFEADGRLLSRPLIEAAEAAAEADRALQEWADRMGARLAPAIAQISAELQTVVERGPGIGRDLGESIGQGLLQTFGNMGSTFAQAFTGGGGLAGAFKALGVQLADSIVKPIAKRLSELSIGRQAAIGAGVGAAALVGGVTGGGAGAMVGQYAGLIGGAALHMSGLVSSTVALGAATAGIGAAAVGVYLLAKHWFGVSKEIKETRAAVEEYQTALHNTLDAQQRQEAGNERWRMTLVAVRDAFEKVGYSAAMAEDLVGKMLNTDDPGQARQAMQAINTVMQEYEARVTTGRSLFSELMDTMARGGQAVPPQLQGMVDRLLEIGAITKDDADAFASLANAVPSVQAVEEAAKALNMDLNALGPQFD
jgi:hypothetical protein